jgi:hypothetical protein
MLAEATARNNSLKDLGNRRSQLNIFDRSGHEGLDREESQIFGGAPRSSYAGGGITSMFAPSGPKTVDPPVDKSKFNTDGFASPGYTAANAGGFLRGWDETKWNDPNHQTPKYVIGRILGEASGGTGELKDAAQRDMAVKNILAAYPGATFDGKDKITMPDGGVIDIFEGAGSGLYRASFQLQDGTGKDPSGRPLPQTFAPADPLTPGLESIPTDRAGASSILQQILAQLGSDPSLQKALKY